MNRVVHALSPVAVATAMARSGLTLLVEIEPDDHRPRPTSAKR